MDNVQNTMSQAAELIARLDTLPSSVVRTAYQNGVFEKPKNNSIESLTKRLSVDTDTILSTLTVLKSLKLIDLPEGAQYYDLTPLGEMLSDQEPDITGIRALMGTSPIAASFWDNANFLEVIKESLENDSINDSITVNRWTEMDTTALAEQKTAFEQNPEIGFLPFMQSTLFATFNTVLDLGGGVGIRAACLKRIHPHLEVTVQDIYPESEALPAIDRYIKSSFFDSVAPGFDGYLLCQILEDWSDSQLIKLLNLIHHAVKGTSSKIIVASSEYLDFGQNYGTTTLRLLSNMVAPNRKVDQIVSLFNSTGFIKKEELYFPKSPTQRPYMLVFSASEKPHV